MDSSAVGKSVKDARDHFPYMPHISSIELVYGLGLITLWFVIFVCGTIIPTADHRAVLLKGDVGLDTLGSITIVMLFWTVPNVGILATLSSCIGAFGRRVRFASPPNQGLNGSDKEAAESRINLCYASAIVRGFAIYGLLLAGLLVLATDTISNPQQDEYLRLAGTVSLLSFYTGYDPALLSGLLNRIEKIISFSGFADAENKKSG